MRNPTAPVLTPIEFFLAGRIEASSGSCLAGRAANSPTPTVIAQFALAAFT
jgi:hypothetical protein